MGEGTLRSLGSTWILLLANYALTFKFSFPSSSFFLIVKWGNQKEIRFSSKIQWLNSDTRSLGSAWILLLTNCAYNSQVFFSSFSSSFSLLKWGESEKDKF